MGKYFYWGEANNPKRSTNNDQRSGRTSGTAKKASDSPGTPQDDGWTRTRIRVDRLSYGHSPDKRGERTDKWGKEPIVVRRGWLGTLVVHDGNDRLYYARQRGEAWIDAWVRT